MYSVQHLRFMMFHEVFSAYRRGIYMHSDTSYNSFYSKPLIKTVYIFGLFLIYVCMIKIFCNIYLLETKKMHAEQRPKAK